MGIHKNAACGDANEQSSMFYMGEAAAAVDELAWAVKQSQKLGMSC